MKEPLTEKARSILIVEDEAIVAMDLSRQFESHGYVVAAVVGKAAEVLPAVQKHRPSVVLMDVRLRGDVDGVTLAEEVFVCEDTPVVFLSAFSDRDLVRRAAPSGAYAYLTKPVTTAALIATVEMAIHKHEDLRARRSDAEWLLRAFDAVDVAVVGLDPAGEVRFMNRAALALTGSALVEARGGAAAWAAALARLEPTAHDDPPHPLAFETKSGVTNTSVRKFSLDDGGSVCVIQTS
jgi:CheY-like chemotaxis protein